MFYYLEGSVAVMEHGLAVLDVGGAGYALTVSLNTMSRLELGKRAKLYTYFQVRDDAFEIFGFWDMREKRSFEMLLSVSGVGPKAAISILSAVTPEDMAMAVVTENDKVFTAAQGIGKKIAQRIILELKDKVAKENVIPAAKSAQPGDNRGTKLTEVSQALSVLGYTPQEIGAILRDPQTAAMSTEEIIRQALKNSLKQER